MFLAKGTSGDCLYSSGSHVELSLAMIAGCRRLLFVGAVEGMTKSVPVGELKCVVGCEQERAGMKGFSCGRLSSERGSGVSSLRRRGMADNGGMDGSLGGGACGVSGGAVLYGDG